MKIASKVSKLERSRERHVLSFVIINFAPSLWVILSYLLQNVNAFSQQMFAFSYLL